MDLNLINLGDQIINSISFKVTLVLDGCNSETSDEIELNSSSGLSENSCGELLFTFDSETCILRSQDIVGASLIHDPCGPLIIDFEDQLCKSISRIRWFFQESTNSEKENVVVESNMEFSILPDQVGFYSVQITYTDELVQDLGPVQVSSIESQLPAYNVQEHNGTCDKGPYISVDFSGIEGQERVDIIVQGATIEYDRLVSANEIVLLPIVEPGTYTVVVRGLEENCYAFPQTVTWKI